MNKNTQSWTHDYNDNDFDDLEQEEWNKYMRVVKRKIDLARLKSMSCWIILSFFWIELLFWVLTGELLFTAICNMVSS